MTVKVETRCRMCTKSLQNGVSFSPSSFVHFVERLVGLQVAHWIARLLETGYWLVRGRCSENWLWNCRQ